jgi:hypothetical protein
LIRAIKLGEKSGYLITKSGLALGFGSLGAVIASIVIGWITLSNTNSLNRDNKNLVNKLEHQVMEAREANCKLKLYDVLSGRAGTLLFKKAHVINPFFEKGINHTIEIVESIPSEKNCTGIFVVPKGGGKKQQVGGLTLSDIKYANEVLGEILYEPRGFQKRNEKKVQNSIEHKKSVLTHNQIRKKKRRQKSGKSQAKVRQKKKQDKTTSTIISPPAPVTFPASSQVPPAPVAAESIKHEKREEKKKEREENNQGDKEENKNQKCSVEVTIHGKISQELKICH